MGYDPEKINPWEGSPTIKPEEYQVPHGKMPGNSSDAVMVIGLNGEGHNIPRRWLNDPYFQDLLKQQDVTVNNATVPGGKETIALSTPKYSYWQNPTNIAMNYNIIRSAPPGWQPPEWIDPDAITAAYEYMSERNEGKPWYEWQSLPEGDSGLDYLRKMKQPPSQVLWGEDALRELRAKQMQQMQDTQGRWGGLLKYEQALNTLLMSGAQTQNLADRPLGSKIVGSLSQSWPMFLLGGKIGQTVGKLPGMVVGALALGGGTFYQGLTGKEVPGLSQVLMAFNFAAQAVEQTYGINLMESKTTNANQLQGLADIEALAKQKNISWDRAASEIISAAWKNRDQNSAAYFENLKQSFKDLPVNWEAARLAYETGDYSVLEPLAKVLAGLYGEEYRGIPGGVFRFEQGKSGQYLPAYGKGVKALDAAKARINELMNEGATLREASDQTYAEFNMEYGASGIANDFALQSVLDPMQLLPRGMNAAGEKIARFRGNERLATAFKETRGNLAIDALPFGVQQFAEAVTKQRSTLGIFETLDQYKTSIRFGHYAGDYTDYPADMRAKWDELVKSGVDPKTIDNNGATLIWKDANGKEQTYKASRAPREIPEARDLTDFEKFIGGLDDTYGFKELRPNTGMKWYQKLSSLTPESQTHLMLNTFHSSMATLMDAANGDVDLMGKLWRQAAGLEKVARGDVGEQILKSPAMTAIQQAIKYAATKDNSLDNMLISWNASKDRRMILMKIANALKEKPANILEQLELEPDTLIRRINDVAPQVGDAKFIKDTLGVFTGKDALPWSETEMQAHLLINMADKMDGWFQNTLGLKPNSWVFRLSNTLKGVQSLLLLGLNPAYFLNNAINNIVTRASVGVFGFLTPRQINNTLERLRITPPRLDVGVGAADEGAIYGGKGIIAEATEASDLIAKSQKRIDKINRGAGVFSRLSGAVERSESRQATIIGITTFWNRNWKQGQGFKRMSPSIEAILDQRAPGMKNVLYGAIEAGMNIDEIEKAIFGEYMKPSISQVAQKVSDTLYPGEPGMVEDMLTKTSIMDQLFVKLKDATDPSQVDTAIWEIRDQVDAFVDAAFSREIAKRSLEVVNIVNKEKLVGVLQLYGDTEIMIGQHWVNARKAVDDLYYRKSQGEFSSEQWNKEWKALSASQDKEWRRVYEFETQTLSGIFDGLDIKNERSRKFIDLLNQNHDNWKQFHEETRKLRDRYFENSHRKDGETYDTWQSRTNAEWKATEQKINDLYNKATALEEKLQTGMDEEFAQSYAEFTGWDIEKAKEWRKAIREVRKRTVQAQLDIREKTADMVGEEKDRAYAEFNPIYNRMIADMKELENRGAFELARQPVPEPEKKVEVPPARQPKPLVPEEPDWIEEAPAAEAAGAAAQAKREQIMSLAAKFGITDKKGNPVARYALNVIRKYGKDYIDANGEKPYFESDFKNLGDVPPELAEYAFNQHYLAHQVTKARETITAKTQAEDIALIADRQKRMATIRERGYATREEIKEYLIRQYGVSETEVNAAMVVMESHADTLALQTGFAPGEAYRDYWYATRFALDDNGKITNKGLFENLAQELRQGEARGSINFLEDGRALVRGLNAPDFSTMMHEVGHIFRRDLSTADLDTVARHGGLSGAAELQNLEARYWSATATPEEAARYVQAEETFARGWERYLAEGDAPTMALKSVFRKFTDWMLNIYHKLFKTGGRVSGFETAQDFTVGGKTVDIQAKINGVSLKDIFDKMLVDQPSRPQSWDQIYRRRFEDIKNSGRNYRFNDDEITRMAKKEAARYVLGKFGSEEEAIKFVDDAVDNYLQGDDGKLIHDTAVYDALRELETNPDLAPWHKPEVVRIMGGKTSAKSIQGDTRYKMTYAVMELDDIISSDRFEGDAIKPNPLYDQAKQPRDRQAQASREQIENNASKLDPEKLLDEFKAIDRGAPILDQDNMVLSGNGRILYISRAIDAYPNRWLEYRSALDDYAVEHGIDPESFKTMKHPVLVRVLDDTMDADAIKKFVNDANTRENLAMNDQEIAVNDVGSISKEALAKLEVGDDDTVEGMLKRAANRDFITSFLQNKVADTEKGQYIVKGQFTEKAITRIKNAMFANIYTNDAAKQLLDQFTTFNTKAQMRTVESVMYKVLPQLAELDGDISRGRINPDLSLSNDIAVAADRLRWFRQQNKLGNIDELINTPPMFVEPLTRTQEFLLRMMAGLKNEKPLRDFIRTYVDEALKEPDPRQASLFGDQKFRNKEEVMYDAQTRFEQAGGKYEPALSNEQANGGQVDAQATAPAALVVPPNDRGGETAGPGMVEEKLPPPGAEQPKIEAQPQPVETPPVEPPAPVKTQAEIEILNRRRQNRRAAREAQLRSDQWLLDQARQDAIETNDRATLEKLAGLEAGGMTEGEGIWLYKYVMGEASYLSTLSKEERAKLAMVQKEYSYKDLYDQGEAVPIDEIKNIDLNHTDKVPQWDQVTEYLSNGINKLISDKDQRAYAREYANWILDGEHGEPPTSSKISAAEIAFVKKQVDLARESLLRVEARNRTTPIPLVDSDASYPPGEGTYIQKVYAFKHGQYDVVAEVYRDGEPIALYPAHPELFKEFNANGGEARLLGIDRENPALWVYEIDGEIKKVDPDNPSIEKAEPTPGLEQGKIQSNRNQINMFSESQEDLPLFSGTPIPVDDVDFRPKEASPQMSLFEDLVPEAKPTRIVELAIRGSDGTSYVRIDIQKLRQIEETLKLHQGEQITYRILDASGKVITSGTNPEDIYSPSLFQVGLRERHELPDIEGWINGYCNEFP